MDFYWLSSSHHFEIFMVTTMTLLAATECLCQKIMFVFVCRHHNSVHSSFKSCDRDCEKSNKTFTTCGRETACSSGAMSSIPVVGGVPFTRSVVLCVIL